MVKKNMLMMYGGMALPVLAIAIFMFTRGNFTSILIGIFIVAFAGMGGTIFHTSLRHNKGLAKFNAWLEGTPIPIKTQKVSEIQAEFASLESRTEDAQKKLEAEVKSEGKLKQLMNSFVSNIKLYSPKEKRKELQAAQAQVVEETKNRLLQTGEGIAVELETSKKLLASVIAELHEEVETAKALNSDPKKGAVARKKNLATLEDKLKRDMKAYAAALNSQDSEKKIARLRSLEEKLSGAMAQDIDQILFKEVGEAESQARYLEALRGRIQSTVEKLSSAIKPDWRDMKYDEMQAQLDRIDKAVDNLIPAAKKHHELAIQASMTVKEFHEHIIGLKQSKFIEMRVTHAAQAEIARANAEDASRKINDLESRLAASEKENKELKEKVAALETDLGDVNATLKRWQDDLAEAREVSKKSKDDLESALIDRLSKNVNEQENIITRMIKSLVAKEQLRSSEETRARNAEDQLTQSNRRIKELEDAENKLTNAKEDLEAEQRTLLENKKAMEEDIDRLNKDLTKLAPEIEADVREQLRLEHEEAIKENQEKIRAIGTEMSAIQAENSTLEQELADTHSKLKEARAEAGRFETAAKNADDAMIEANESLISARAIFEKVKKEKDSEIAELQKKEKEMQSSIDDTEKELDRLNKELRHLQTLYDQEHEEAERWSKEALKASEKAGKDIEKTREDLTIKIRGLVTRDKSLTVALEKKKESLAKMTREMQEWKNRYEKETLPAKEAAAENEIELGNIRKLLVEQIDNVDRLKFELSQAKTKKMSSDEEGDDEELGEFLRNLNNSIAEKNELIKNLKEDKSTIEAQKKEAEERAKNAEAHKTNLDRKIDRMKAEHEEVTAKLKNRLDEQILIEDNLKSDLDTLEGKASEMDREITRLETAEKYINQQLAEKSAELETAQNQGAASDILKTKLLERDSLVEELSGDIEALQKDFALLSEIRGELVEKNEILERESSIAIERLERAMNTAIQEAAEANGKAENIREEKERIEKDLRELQPKLKQSEHQAAQVPGMQMELENVRGKLADRQAELNAANSQLQEEITRNQNLTRQVEQFRGQITRLQEQLEQASQDAETDRVKKQKEDRRQAFLKVKRVVALKVREVESSGGSPTEILTAMDETVAFAEKVKKEHPFLTDIEKGEIDSLVEILTQHRRYYQGKIQQTASPPPTPIEALAPKVITIGDVHGDYNRLVNILFKSKVIDKGLNWAAKKGTKVVLLGDYIDRGPHTFKTLEFIERLKKNAGDNLVLLIGNHEAMFLGAFDWEGYDNPKSRTYRKFMEFKNTFETKLIDTIEQYNIKFNDNMKKNIAFTLLNADFFYPGKENNAMRQRIGQMAGAVLGGLINKKEFKKYRALYLRLEFLKSSWMFNDKRGVCKELGLDPVEVAANPNVLINAKAESKKISEHIKFLRENLEVHYIDEHENILFIHAGIPYYVTNNESIDFSQAREFRNSKNTGTPYFSRKELENVCKTIKNAIRSRNIQLWMAYSESSPLFASNPLNRAKDWDIISQYADNIERWIPEKFGFNAVVFGHSRQAPNEEQFKIDFQNKLRHKYNIDFGMSQAYNLSLGGWLSVNANETITVHVQYNENAFRQYTYNYKPEEQKKTKKSAPNN